MAESRAPGTAVTQADIAQIRSDPTDGWWFAGVLDAFDYLEPEFGFCVDQLHEHFRGNYVYFQGPVFDLVIEHDPEDTGRVSAELWVHEDVATAEHPRAFSVNDVLRSRDPNATLPDLHRGGYAREEALDALVTWAAGLRTLAPDVLRGAWPADTPIKSLW